MARRIDEMVGQMIWRVIGRLVVGLIAFAVAVACCLTIASPVILQNWDNHHLLAENAAQFVGIFLIGWATSWLVRWERAR